MNTNPTPDALAERLRSYAGTCTGLEPKRIMIAAADSLESLHAKPVVGERVEETGWLIEYGPSSPTAPRYWGGVRGWTYDHMEAVRFSRQVDAQSIAESMDDGVPGNYRLAEHAWASAALQSPPPVVSGEAKHDRGCNSHQDYPCDCATLTASPPVVEREAIALALLNESRRFSGLPLLAGLNGLQPHQYRDQLRYADAILGRGE